MTNTKIKKFGNTVFEIIFVLFIFLIFSIILIKYYETTQKVEKENQELKTKFSIVQDRLNKQEENNETIKEELIAYIKKQLEGSTYALMKSGKKV